MIKIEKVTKRDIVKFEIVRAIAQETWPITYRAILSSKQLEYMFDMMYSTKSLLEQAAMKNLQFILIKVENKYLGFDSYEKDCMGTNKTKVQKI